MPVVAKSVKIQNWIKSKKFFFLYFLSSLGLMLCAQPDLSIFSCIAASVCGYAFFWKANSYFDSKKQRFYAAALWFALISFGHLSWFTADRYVGWPIFIFLAILVAVLGVFFGILSLFVTRPEKVTVIRCLQIASMWTVFEWSRLFFMSGFSWDPIGIILTANIYSLQLASIVGIFGLTFWTIFTNMLVYRLFARYNMFHLAFCIIVALLPYVYGISKINYHKTKLENYETLSALLLQTSLYPEEKTQYPGQEKKMMPLFDQWQRIFRLVKEHQYQPIDLVLLSEAAVPYGTFLPIYPQKEAASLLASEFFQIPFFTQDEMVGNAYFVQNLSQILDADVIIGLEDGEWKEEKFKVYNAAFLFHPNGLAPERYEKRVLVPMGEYIPFSFCKKFLSKYGISDSLSPGNDAKVIFGKKIPIGLSICYEETYGHLMRHNRMQGAKLLANLTNDVWYPYSRLPIVHFHHGRVRAVEGGLPLVRSSNTGVTCAVDSLGRIVDMLPYEKKNEKSPCAAMHVNISTYCYSTLYAKWGDATIIALSLFCILLPTFAKFWLWKYNSKEIEIEQN